MTLDQSHLQAEEAEDEGTGVTGYGVLMAILAAGSGLMFVLGWFIPDSAVQQAAFWAGAAVLAIGCRIAQAAGHHAILLDELRRR